MTRPRFPYGDGRAGERIAAMIAEWLERRQSALRMA
jgi:UDP-N-acetylglucosamine 2-epimerase